MPNGEKKGITVRIDADLHAEVSQYLRDHSMTMAEFVSLALDDELHPKNQMKEGNTMANTRSRSLTRAISRSISLPATRSHIIRRMLSTAIRSVCSLSFWRKTRMLSVGSSRRSISLAYSGKPDNSIILIFSWKQLPENSWSKLRL